MQEVGGGDSMHLLLSILADGEEQARRLLGELPATAGNQLPPAKECCRDVARQLRCTFGKAIAVAKAIEASHGGASSTDSPRSAEENSGAVVAASRDAAQAQESQGICKRRKGLPRWTQKFRIPDANLDYTPDDGLSWRKYGQKDILGARFPRGYYRCTYRNSQGCPATKHVQRSDADLAVFDVTYQGEHTCHQNQRNADAAPPPPAVAAASDGGHHPPLQDPDVQMLASFNNSLKVETDGMPRSSSSFHGHDVSAAAFSFPYPTSAGFTPVECTGYKQLPAGGGCFSAAPFFSPAATTSAESGYFSVAAHFPAVGTRGPESSELGEVVSAATSSAAVAARLDNSLYEYQLHDDDFNSFLPNARSPFFP
ncbi:uncharacterized protein [Lolium perenne]|uniref:uncharacterized protein n=1 Tax=Lolium perenne TaxID=4522 RepID=UPI0021F56719|nr:transcription factor WRKY19-like [Lolium perenne]